VATMKNLSGMVGLILINAAAASAEPVEVRLGGHKFTPAAVSAVGAAMAGE